MNILKSAVAGAASAVGTHYADEAVNPTPHSQMVYYGVAAGAALGAYLLRKRSPIGAGALLGIGIGSAFQGYTRSLPAAPIAAAPPTYQQYTKYTPQYAPRPQYVPAPQYAPPPSQGLPMSPQQLQDIYGVAQQALPGIESLFGVSEPAPVPYTQEQYEADTASFDSDWS